jgi:hypothetical protein
LTDVIDVQRDRSAQAEEGNFGETLGASIGRARPALLYSRARSHLIDSRMSIVNIGWFIVVPVALVADTELLVRDTSSLVLSSASRG